MGVGRNGVVWVGWERRGAHSAINNKPVAGRRGTCFKSKQTRLKKDAPVSLLIVIFFLFCLVKTPPPLLPQKCGTAPASPPCHLFSIPPPPSTHTDTYRVTLPPPPSSIITRGPGSVVVIERPPLSPALGFTLNCPAPSVLPSCRLVSPRLEEQRRHGGLGKVRRLGRDDGVDHPVGERLLRRHEEVAVAVLLQ